MEDARGDDGEGDWGRGGLGRTGGEDEDGTLTDTNLLIEHAVYSAAMEENSPILHSILKWSHSQKTRKFTHKSKAYAGSTGPKVNANAMLHAAKRDDYERVKILYRLAELRAK